MTTSFKDYFSKQAQDYARYRPRYPEALFKYLAEISPFQQAVWDCGTGNGQVALSLTAYFEQVYATDASASQISQAFQHEKIQYQVATAENIMLNDKSIDLVTVGQALHWFNLEQFYQQVRRVTKPQGVIAVWCYGLFELAAEEVCLNELLQQYYVMVEPFWPAERELVNHKYQSIPFPFHEEAVPAFAMTANWNFDNLVGYLLTWSATQRFIEQYTSEAVAQLFNEMKAVWSNSKNTKLIEWPLYIRIGRVI